MTDYQKYFLQIHLSVLVFALLAISQLEVFSWMILAYILVFYFLTYVIGFNLVHRAMSHNQLKLTKFGKYAVGFLSLFVMVGDPITLSKIHRYHHRFVDTELDPHTPTKGLVYSFIGWLFDTKKPAIPLFTVKDLLKDNYLVFLLREQKKIIWGTIIILSLINLEIGLSICLCMWINWIKECFSVSMFDHSARAKSPINLPSWSWIGLGDYHYDHHRNPNIIYPQGPSKVVQFISKKLYLVT